VTESSTILDAIIRCLTNIRVLPGLSEYEVHTMITAALRNGGFDMRHEVAIAPRCRIDFLIGSIGIEIKKGRPQREKLMRQSEKYLVLEEISALILVVERNVTMPRFICGKPVFVIGLNKQWGVALP
jgi:CRISPR/Cas system-associated exonuclease Cas4 (RecB family)